MAAQRGNGRSGSARRDAIVAMLAIAAAPCLALAQPSGKRVHRVIYFPDATINAGETPVGARSFGVLKSQLATHGLDEPRDVELKHIFDTVGEVRLKTAFRDALDWSPDVILVEGTRMTREVQRLTKTIPIVFVNVADPLGSELVPSIARPGGNTTGATQFYALLAMKRLEVTREILPEARSVAVVWDRAFKYYPGFYNEFGKAAERLGFELIEGDMERSGSWEAVLAELAPRRPGAVLPLGPWPSLRVRPEGRPLVDFQEKTRIPVIFGIINQDYDDCLVQLGADSGEHYRRAADIVVRVLAGERPGDISVDQATRILVQVNLRTARRLGVKVPKALLLRADRVIE